MEIFKFLALNFGDEAWNRLRLPARSFNKLVGSQYSDANLEEGQTISLTTGELWAWPRITFSIPA